MEELSDILIKDDLTVNEMTWKRQEPSPNSQPTEADNIIDNFISTGKENAASQRKSGRETL